MSGNKSGTRLQKACLGVDGFFLCEVRGPEKIISHNTSSIHLRAKSYVRPRLEALSGSGPTSRCLTKVTGPGFCSLLLSRVKPVFYPVFNIRGVLNALSLLKRSRKVGAFLNPVFGLEFEGLCSF